MKSAERSGGRCPGSFRGEMYAVITRSGLNPGSIRISAMKLPMKSAAPTSSTTASATSATTSTLRRRWRPRPALAARVLVLQRMCEIGFRELKGGDDPGEEAGDERQACGGGEHPEIHRDVRDSRDAFGHRALQNLHRPPREDDRQDRAGDGEQQALGEELPNQAPAAGAERGPDRHLALARARAREQQVRDVGAGNQQHDADRAEQHQHPRPRAGGNEVIVERTHADRAALVRRRVGLLDGGGDLVHLRLRLRDGDAGLQPRDDLKIVAERPSTADPLALGNDVRNPEIRRAQRLRPGTSPRPA